MTETDPQFARQDLLLPGVSRTFALTIPQLPARLRHAVTNAYLLCRIADTIEDDPALPAAEKEKFHARFVESLDTNAGAALLARELGRLLSDATPVAERDLIAEIESVIATSHALPQVQREAIFQCVATMCDGMPRFQRSHSLQGLDDLQAMESYCYYVAGVVGEMLTELFTEHTPALEPHRDRMMRLSVSFGQGLQMTNILKDFWDDRKRNACWLPRNIFARHGLNLAELGAARQQIAAFAAGIRDLTGIAHACLRDAFAYVKLIPSQEIGIRRFCLWAIGLAILTLRKVHGTPEYTSSGEVKVSRRALKLTVAICNLLTRSNRGLGMAFNAVASGLPLNTIYGVSRQHVVVSTGDSA